MSIIETKFFKDRVETPILITNEVKSQKLSGDVIMQGYSLHDILFMDQMTQKKIDVSELLEQSNIKYNAQQIYSFYMGVTDYRGKAIKSIHLRRDGNKGNAISRTNEVYLYADCYDENGNLVDTIFSENKEMQDGSDMVTTWNFNPHIYIHDYYKQIKFYCSTVKGERQFQNTNTRVNIRSQSIRYKVQPQGKPNENPMPSEDWKTYDQAGQKAFTTDFAFTLMVRQLGFVKHMQNDILHLTDTKNELINSIPSISQGLSNHVTNQEVHVTTDQKEKLKTLHILQTSYNIHKNNKTIHITEDERNKWNQKFGLNQIIDFLDVPAKIFSTLKQGFVNNSGGKTDAICIQLSQPHFTTGKIFEVQIPYIGGKDKTSYLCAQIFTNDEDENTEKTLKDCIFSENTQTQPSSSPNNPKSCYQFNNLVLPQDYKFVRFIFTEDNERLPNISTEENCVPMRVKIITEQSNETGWQDWDDDECKLYLDRNTTKNWYGYVNAVQPEKIYGVTQQEKDKWNDHVNDDTIHVTADDKTEISKITPLKTLVDSHIGDATHLTSEEKDKISSLIDAISVETIQYNIDTRQLLPNYTGFGNESSVGFTMTVDQSYREMIVDELDLRRNDNSNLNGNDLYIYAQCFNSNNEQINVFYSTNTDTQTSGDDKIMTWTFDDFVIPNECSSIKFYYTTIKGQKQTNVAVRTAKLLQNGTTLYKDGWKTIWPGGSNKNITTDFALRGHKTKINEIIELETLLDNHKGDDTHLTADQKNFIQTISSSFIETEQFTSKQDGMTITEKASCKYFDISKKHFISGVSGKIKLLKKIEIPYLSGGTAYSDVYLCIQFYKNSNEQKTLEDCIFSTNTQNQTSSNGLLSFEFTDVEIPEDYLFMRVYLCSDTTSIPDGTKLLRITPLKTDSLSFDDDECRVVGSNGTEYNWIVYLNAQTEEKFGYQNYKMLLQKVFDLSELVKSLQEELEELKGNSSN